MPDAAEISRRIKAARELRQLSQKDVAAKFEADGLDKTSPGRIERGEITMQRAHRDAFIRHLRVPEQWFTAETVDLVVGYEDDGARDASISSIRADLATVLKKLDERRDIKRDIHEAFEEYARRLGPEIGKRPPRSRRSQDPPAEEPPAAA